MRDGFVRVAAGTPKIILANPKVNARETLSLMKQASDAGCKLLVLPELCLTGATCGDLFLQQTLLDSALDALNFLVEQSDGLDLLTVVGLPYTHEGRLYDCAAVFKDGLLLGLIPKACPPPREARWFASCEKGIQVTSVFGEYIPFGPSLVFQSEEMPPFSVGVSISVDDIYSSTPNIIACLCAEPEIVGSKQKLELCAQYNSMQLCAGCVVANAGEGESSTDYVFSGRNLIFEVGRKLSMSEPYTTGLIMSELDVAFIEARRRTLNVDYTFEEAPIRFGVQLDDLQLSRVFEPTPFVPANEAECAERCEEILSIQVQGLVQRMRAINCKNLVLGISGGLDSTLAMLVASRALGFLNLSPENLLAITMPCFGTTSRTKGNAQKLSEALCATFREIDITKAVTQHFADIGQDMNNPDVTFENAQARERTQVLMDVGNQTGAFLVGTGDLSELMLGWATYNGDHMSMYGVNGGIPKTLVKHLVRHVAETAEDKALKHVLLDILDTPVSPELLPPKDGEISQKTEEIVGPYQLHDFFIYHLIRRMESPEKIKRLAIQSFKGYYGEEEIDKWLRVFVKRFFSQQFKRSCLPDGPKIGSVGVSPRGDLVMPSDASSQLWLEILD